MPAELPIDPTLPVFEPFSAQHWIALGLTLGLAFALPLLVRALAGDARRDALRKALALCLLGYVLAAMAVRVGIYDLELRNNLPLQLCGAALWLGALMLWLHSYRLYEVAYFWGTGGALAAMITPDLLSGFPHPLFFLFFLGHGLAFLGVTYATVVCGFRPRARSVLIAVAATVGYAVLMLPVNFVLRTNYLYLARKPLQPSPLDWFGPWPTYLVGLAALMGVACVLCYLPFAAADGVRRMRRALRVSAPTGAGDEKGRA